VAYRDEYSAAQREKGEIMFHPIIFDVVVAIIRAILGI
jgi:hypothetical protein